MPILGKAMLRIKGLHFSYGDLKVLWDVDIDVNAGEIVTVVGANGAGKSTLIRNISGLEKPGSGSITFNGTDIGTLHAHEVVELGIVQVPEGRKIFPQMTVIENLRMGSFIARARKLRAANMERVFAMFPRLKEREKQLGGTMSGGEQQMLAIARGLMADPKLLLLDEPSLGLSPLLVKAIFEIIAEIRKQGVTVMLVEQNVFQSLKIADRGYVLETGRVVFKDAGSALLTNEHIKKAYLGM